MCDLRLYLASRSPRRRELLEQIGLSPADAASPVDETAVEGEAPEAFVLRLAEEKARAAERQLHPERAPGVVLAADTAVVLGDEILGKPLDSADAVGMLRRLRGREHRVMTGVFCLRTDDGRSSGGVDVTRVSFRDYADSTIDAYVASGEPMDKAGAYGIQGRGAMLSTGIVGSWSNVVGLPLERLPGWLAELGVDLDTWVRWS